MYLGVLKLYLYATYIIYVLIVFLRPKALCAEHITVRTIASGCICSFAVAALCAEHIKFAQLRLDVYVFN